MIRTEKILFSIIIAFFLFVSFFHFQTNPDSWFDEGIFHQIVSNVSQGGVIGVQLSENNFSDSSLISVGYSVLYPASTAFIAFGDSITVLRLVAIGFLIGFVLCFYFLVRKLYGSKHALLSLLLLSMFSPLYGNGVNFLGEVPGLFYFTGALLLSAYSFSDKIKQNISLIFITGVLFGLAISAKPIYILIIPALGVAFLIKWKFFLKSKQGLKLLSIFSFGLLIPLAYWWYTQFGPTVSFGRVFQHYSNPYYITDYYFVITGNLKRFVTESTPMHFIVMLVLALFLVIKKFFSKTQLYFAEIVGVVFVGLIFLFYLRTIGWYRNFFPGHAMLFIFFSFAFWEFLKSIHFIPIKYIKTVLFAGIFLLALFQGKPMLEERFNTDGDVSTDAENYLSQISEQESVFFYSVPYVASRYTKDNFSQYIEMSESLSLGSENLEKFQSGEFSLVFIPTNNINVAPNCYFVEDNIRKISILKRKKDSICE